MENISIKDVKKIKNIVFIQCMICGHLNGIEHYDSAYLIDLLDNNKNNLNLQTDSFILKSL